MIPGIFSSPLFLFFFRKKPLTSQFSVYVSTYAINYSEHRDLAMKPNYILSKFTGTYGYSLLADGVKPEVMQVVSFHPGVSFTENWSQFGITKEMLPFDESAFILYSCSLLSKYPIFH